jgi:hypothetical protein
MTITPNQVKQVSSDSTGPRRANVFLSDLGILGLATRVELRPNESIIGVSPVSRTPAKGDGQKVQTQILPAEAFAVSSPCSAAHALDLSSTPETRAQGYLPELHSRSLAFTGGT